ncbi:hypothetical protein AYJ09_01090 [Candidatus Liberibacter solanacearum]|uniref:hypothetical protein n=1 Tax=Candidatus Liberibacter solanacearum TaxID=556287 RepID=UPI000978F590|nr:hypothetical protein [Candidatus Liberibacter solanacearum]ONI59013.1 hypothetical protein AYJ09_01090 [Candidatus Liberibacter solanacearum]
MMKKSKFIFAIISTTATLISCISSEKKPNKSDKVAGDAQKLAQVIQEKKESKEETTRVAGEAKEEAIKLAEATRIVEARKAEATRIVESRKAKAARAEKAKDEAQKHIYLTEEKKEEKPSNSRSSREKRVPSSHDNDGNTDVLEVAILD